MVLHWVSIINPAKFPLLHHKSHHRLNPMASLSAARSILRPNAARSAAARLVSHIKSKPAPSVFRATSSRTPLASRTFRCPVESSFCLESMLPYHTVTASALMTSMLSISSRSSAWLPEACNDDV